jgi:putative membrane protein
MHKLGTILVIVLGVLAALWLGGAGMMGYSGFGMDSGMMRGIGTGIAPIYLALIIGLGLVILLWLMARTPKHAMAATGGSALDISKARYAKGEISKEQFDAIKRDLRA